MWLFGALVLMLIFGGAAGAVGASSNPDAAVALPFIGLTGVTLVFFALAISLPAIIVGIGLWRMRPWARILGIVVAVLQLMWIPFGTIVGVYALWVLFNKETERLFAMPSQAAVSK